MFKTFPEFSKLALADREEYEALTKGYPPISDIAFASLMLWWDGIGETRVSRLNGNLVISYWIPGDEVHSGLALIGTENVDQSICAIFDYMREQGQVPRLVNVPEFVVNGLRYPELFTFKSGREDDEYLVSLHKFALPDSLPAYMRIRIRRFVRETGKDNMILKSLDLSATQNRQLLLGKTASWPLKGINNIAKLERDVLPLTIANGPAVDMQNICLYIAGQLEAYCLYTLSGDGQYAMVQHARVNYDIPRIFDYMVHAFSNYWVEQGAEYANIHADSGSLKMRAIKIALKPDNFFRKYNIEPV